MKRLILLIALTCIVSGCKSSTRYVKSWIYDDLPQSVWEDKVYDAVNTEYHRVLDVLTEYANKSITSYTESTYESESLVKSIIRAGGGSMSDYYDPFTDMMMGAFLGVDYGPSAEKKRNEAINAYKANYESVTAELRDNLGECLAYRDSIFEEAEHFTDEEICQHLMGTPTNIPQNDDDMVRNISYDVFARVISKLTRPAVSSSEYNKEKDIWVVRFDNADTHYVKAIQRDDGSIECLYSKNSSEWDV